VNVDRDVLSRLDGLGVRWYVTGAWALGAYAEPRTTRDLDHVLELDRGGYEARIRPAFADDYLVNDPIDVGGRLIGGVVHRTEIARADLIFGRDDAWARSAMDRRRRLHHPGLGATWVIRGRTSCWPSSNGRMAERPSSSFATVARSCGSTRTSTGDISRRTLGLSASRHSWRRSVAIDQAQHQLDDRVRATSVAVGRF
jgi:hypothetical protein